MVIISDTSPLTALLLVGRGDLLTSLFDRVVIPPAVERELLCAHASLPQWLEVTAPQTIPTSILEVGLDAGETEAIALALELHPDTLLMDERLGRRLAQRHGIPVTGLLGLLLLAKNTGRINAVVPLIRDLQDKGNCWFGHQLLTEVCSVVGEVWACAARQNAPCGNGLPIRSFPQRIFMLSEDRNGTTEGSTYA